MGFGTIRFVNHKTLISLFPDPEPLLQLSPEEIAWVILEIVNSWDPERLRQNLAPHSFTHSEALDYTRLRQEVMEVLAEGWAWLQRECLLVPRPGTSGEYAILSRKAKQMGSRSELEVYRRANLLAGMLHPAIERESKAAFLRGEYETAIFNAFKEIEVAVRQAGGFTANDLGTALINVAFQVKVGPLTDKRIPESEQLGLRNLFSGAIGYYKNPGSHRHFPTDPVEVAETLFFASLLLRIVDRGSSITSGSPTP
jgi:uncharacterized protein (TIGR02391 family)